MMITRNITISLEKIKGILSNEDYYVNNTINENLIKSLSILETHIKGYKIFTESIFGDISGSNKINGNINCDLDSIIPSNPVCILHSDGIFANFWKIKFPHEIIDNLEFVKIFSKILQNILFSISLYIKDIDNFIPLFIENVNNMTRDNYVVSNCPNNKLNIDSKINENKYTCGRAIIPLLCMSDVNYVPRIIIFDTVSSEDDNINEMTFTNYVNSAVEIDDKDKNACVSSLFNSQLGGNKNFKKKYLKYKTKYLKIKNMKY